MNSTQIHLALTHMPVILTLSGMIMLLISLIIKNQTVSKVSLFVLLAAGITALPVYFSGEGAEHMVEEIPGVSESIIEQHEDFAKYAMVVIMLTAIMGAIGLLKFIIQRFGKPFHFFVLTLSFIATGLLVQTAHLGGQIRHSEIRNTSLATFTVDNSDNLGNQTEGEDNNDDDDDHH